MSKKLYVGNLSYSMTDASLAEAFAGVGTVDSARVITERETGRSKGFGFVEMSTEEEARAAIQQLHEKTVQGRPFNVTEARPPAPRESGAGRGSRY